MVPMPGPPRDMLQMTAGREDAASHAMPSLFSEMPQLEEEVMQRTPAQEAPYTILTEATSLSPWMKTPSTSGSLLAKYSGISF